MATTIMTVRGCLLAIGLGLALGAARPAAAQPQPSAGKPSAGSPEAFAERYVQALREERWGDAAAMMHPEALAELRAMFAPIVTHPEGGQVGREVFGLSDPAAFASTSDTALFAGFLRTVTGESPEFVAVMKNARRRGSVCRRRAPRRAWTSSQLTRTKPFSPRRRTNGYGNRPSSRSARLSRRARRETV